MYRYSTYIHTKHVVPYFASEFTIDTSVGTDRGLSVQHLQWFYGLKFYKPLLNFNLTSYAILKKEQWKTYVGRHSRLKIKYRVLNHCIRSSLENFVPAVGDTNPKNSGQVISIGECKFRSH